MSGAPIPSLKFNLDIKRQVLCSKLKIEQQIWTRIINCSTYIFARPSGVASGPSASSSVLWFGHFTNCRFFRRTLNRKRDHGAEKERCRRTDDERTDGRKWRAGGRRQRPMPNPCGSISLQSVLLTPHRRWVSWRKRTDHLLQMRHIIWVGWLGGGNRDVEMMNE